MLKLPHQLASTLQFKITDPRRGELVKEKKIELKYVKSQFNIADGFTKYLNSTLTRNFRNLLVKEIEEY